jgi:hypothetical protein
MPDGRAFVATSLVRGQSTGEASLNVFVNPLAR